MFLVGLTSYAAIQGPIVAFATHPNGTHNYFMHSSANHEWVCVDASNSTLSHQTVLDRASDSLRYGNPTSDWHDLAWGRVYFEFESQSCGSVSNLSDMRMRVYAKDNTDNECNGYSCVYHFSPLLTHDGNTDYAYEKVYLKTSHIDGSAFWYHHTINHEFGHTLGLADPSYGDCQNGNSIMHSGPAYGCDAIEWPTIHDRGAVSDIAQSIDVPE